MKKDILVRGSFIEVDIRRFLYGFKAGDIITDECGMSGWYKKRVRILGADLKSGRLWGVIEGNNEKLFASGSERLILLKRPSYKFKVGDEVVLGSGREGVVVALNPYKNQIRYLVRFSDFRGDNVRLFEDEPWLPLKWKQYREGCDFLCEDDLRLIGGNRKRSRRLPRQNARKSVIPVKRRLKQGKRLAVKVKSTENKQPVEDKWQGQKRIVERIFEELEARLGKGEFPVFEPQDLRIVGAEVQEIKSSRQTRNLRECLRLFGATLFHLVNAESEFDMECYIADADLAYRKKMPVNDFGALVEELLFGEKCTVEKIRGMIA